jgi:hypothetical protein
MQREAVLVAKRAALSTETVIEAMEERARREADALARQITGEDEPRRSEFHLAEIGRDGAGKEMRRR